MGGVAFRDTIGREQKMTIINESDLYSLVLSSKPPSAKQFKRWVTTRQSAAMQHTSNVGVGFIPTLAAAGHLLCILSAVGRAGINPAPTAAECCNAFIIKQLCCFSFYNSAFHPDIRNL